MPDELTGLRTYRDNLLETVELHQSPCLFIKIDELIWLLDQFGVEAQDRAVVIVAQHLLEFLGEFDPAIFRIGNEDFVAFFRASISKTTIQAIALKIVSNVHALAIPYRRLDHPERTVLEVNVVIAPVSPAFADYAFSRTAFRQEARDWLATSIYREKCRVGRDAGVVVDLAGASDLPWLLT